jgi:pimeloyl-ACP methyl ester carboxylesterase
MAALLAGHASMIAVPEAHHHLFLDQPLAFVVALRALLAAWRVDTGNNSRA